MHNPKIDKNGDKRWFNDDGQLHHDDGPAIKYADGTIAWFVNNKRHRINGPAVEYSNGDKYWFINNTLHREDGPAVELANGDKEYWINGYKYDSLNQGLMDQAIR